MARDPMIQHINDTRKTTFGSNEGSTLSDTVVLTQRERESLRTLRQYGVIASVKESMESMVDRYNMIGEGEKLVRALFGVSSCRQPAVIFVVKSIRFSSFSGATNRPQELDEAARRRLTKRLYIPLLFSVDEEAGAWIICNILEKDGIFKLSKEETDTICSLTQGSDMKNLVKDASMGPLREALKQGIEITRMNKDNMRPVTLQEVWPSVSLNELGSYDD